MATHRISVSPSPASVRVRRATVADVDACAHICYDAFTAISNRHGFPPDFPSSDAANHVLTFMFSHPGFYCVVAELDGELVGSNCLDERSMSIAGVGPITVAPAAQNRTIGRTLMQVVMQRAAERRFAGVRLVQAAFHNRSLALYASLGFVLREPLAVLQGAPLRQGFAGVQLRKASSRDLQGCNELCRKIHGHDRAGEVMDAIHEGSAMVVERNGSLTGYATDLGFFGHAVGETNLDIQALIGNVQQFAGPGILVPTRNAPLFRWCLENGLQIIQPMNLMSTGLYNQPAGAFLPSISF
jgi:N-acetylglutamate synthase-like GNAT family acetyltransferase